MKFKYFLCGLMTITTVKRKEDCLKYNEIGVGNSPQFMKDLLISSLLKLRREIKGQLQDVHCIAFLVSEHLAYSAANCLAKANLKNDEKYISSEAATLRLETLSNGSEGSNVLTYKVLFFMVHSCFEGDETKGYKADIGMIQLDLRNVPQPRGPFLKLDLDANVGLEHEVATPRWNSDLSSVTLNFRKKVKPISDCYGRFDIADSAKTICVRHKHQITTEIFQGSPLIIGRSVVGILSYFAVTVSPQAKPNHAVYMRLKSYKKSIPKYNEKIQRLRRELEKYPPENQFFKETTNSAVCKIGECSRTQETPENSSLQSIERTLRSSLVKLRRVINKEEHQVYCIGFLISKDYAYSAAHCLSLAHFSNDHEYMMYHIDNLQVETLPNASRDSKGNIYKYKALSFAVHSNFEGNSEIGYIADFGIIKLDLQSGPGPDGPFLKIDLDYQIKLEDKVGVIEWTSDLSSFSLQYFEAVRPINECFPIGNGFTAAVKVDKICIVDRELSPTELLDGSPVLVGDTVVGIFSFPVIEKVNDLRQYFTVYTALRSYKSSIKNADEVFKKIAKELKSRKFKKPLTFKFGDSIA